MSTFANVYVGAAANDGLGDPLRTAFLKIDQNFDSIANGNVTVDAPVRSVAGRTGNVVLTVNDVQGAGSVAYLNSIVAAGNAYVDSQVLAGNLYVDQQLATLSNINVAVFSANLGTATINIDTLFANAAVQATSIVTLDSQVAILQSNVSALDAEIIATNVAIVTANAAMKSYVDTHHNISSIFSTNVVITSNTVSSGFTTGALVIPGQGGAAIGGNVHIGSTLFVGAEPVGPSLLNVIGEFRGTSSVGPNTQYTQVAIENATNTGSSDLALYSDNGSADGGWADIGFTGGAFNDPAYTITKPNDGYVLAQATTTGYGGNLVLATGNQGSTNDIVFATNGFWSNSEVARFHGNIANNGPVFTVLGNIVAHGVTFGNAYISGNVTALNELIVGAPLNNDLQNTIALFHGTSGYGPANQYTQVAIINSTNTGSTDIALYGDNGSTTGGWIDMGFTGGAFDDPAYTITKPNDGYVLAQGFGQAFGGNLVLATGGNGNTNDIVFATNGFLAENEVARFHGNATTGGTVFTVLGNIVAANVSANLNYTMANSANWNTTVSTVAQALDELAQRLRAAGY